jgi:hypothetical protein
MNADNIPYIKHQYIYIDFLFRVFEEGSFRKRPPKKRLGIAISIGITLITRPPKKHLGVANSIGITMTALKKERSAKGSSKTTEVEWRDIRQKLP